MTAQRIQDAAQVLLILGHAKLSQELIKIADRCRWRPIAEMHEDYGPCILINLEDPGYMEIGNNLDPSYDESQWSHFVPVPSLTHEEAERLRAETQPR